MDDRRGKWKKLANPILFLTDGLDQQTGLARIARDLAALCATMPEFRVGVLGRGQIGRRKFPFTCYSYPVDGQWGEEYLAGVCEDFFGGERGVVLTNWDISRLQWLGRPEYLREDLARAFTRGSRNWDLWGYFPIDGLGPDGQRLPFAQRETLVGFDRVLAASEFGARALAQSGRPDCDWLPHGLFLDKWPLDTHAKRKLGWEGRVAVGCVMANQARKDFPAAFEAAALLKREYGARFLFWLHTDLAMRYWNVHALTADYGLHAGDLVLTTFATDAQLALYYAACESTILPSGGEGFSFPTAESLACGTGAVVTDCAAARELVQPEMRVPPVCFRIDTIHNIQRAVLSGWGFARAAQEEIEKKLADPEFRAEELRDSIQHLDWAKLQHLWKRWLTGGLR